MATMTLTAQEARFLALVTELNTEARELVRTLMQELASASPSPAVLANGGAL